MCRLRHRFIVVLVIDYRLRAGVQLGHVVGEEIRILNGRDGRRRMGCDRIALDLPEEFFHTREFLTGTAELIGQFDRLMPVTASLQDFGFQLSELEHRLVRSTQTRNCRSSVWRERKRVRTIAEDVRVW